MEELLGAEEKDFEAVSNRVVANLDSAFKEYEQQLQAIEQSKKDLISKQLPCVLGSAAFAFAGPITGNYALSLIGTVSSLVGGPTLKDLWRNGRKVVSEGNALRRTPISLLVRPH